MYVFTINQGKAMIGHTEVYTHDNKVIKEITDDPANTNRKIGQKISNLSLNNFTSIQGSVAVLSLNGLENNYYHFWVECLGRFQLLKKSGIKPDYYLLPTKTKFQNEIIQLLKIKPEQIIRLEQNTVICADQLIVPSAINNFKVIKSKKHGMGYVKQWLPSWITELYTNFQQPQSTQTKRIYISRSKACRKVLNEDALIKMLHKYNFQITHLEELSVAEQIKLFNQASIIIAPHGAGLANMIFSKKGTVILELFPQYNQESGLRVLATTLGLDYNYTIGCCKKAIQHNLAKERPEPLINLDFSVNINIIKSFLEKNMPKIINIETRNNLHKKT